MNLKYCFRCLTLFFLEYVKNLHEIRIQFNNCKNAVPFEPTPNFGCGEENENIKSPLSALEQLFKPVHNIIHAETACVSARAAGSAFSYLASSE